MEAASRLNIKTVVLDAPNSPAKQINAGEHVDGSFNNVDDIARLAKKCDVLTVEIEHVDADALELVRKSMNVEIYPLPETIKLIKDKYLQKEHLISHGIKVADLVAVSENSESALAEIGAKFGYPFMLKSRTDAYDGRGNFVVKSPEFHAEALEFLSNRPLYAEKWCRFAKELAVMVVRTIDGEVHAYPTVETVHKDNICHVVYAPARVLDTVRSHAQILANSAVKTFPGCGIFGVEMFLLPDNELLVNEIAPRPHNSGHYTIDACVTSQFEAHVRAVVGLPMPRNVTSFSTTNTAAIMVNVLGDHASVYLYGKTTRPKRKLGHINIVTSSMADAEERLRYIMEGRAPILSIQEAKEAPLVGVIMGSDSDLKAMSVGADILKKFGVPFELTIVSAHRTPHRMIEYATKAAERGIKVIIAGAGGAAHLPGMVAALTPLPVIGVPIKGSTLDGVDSLHSIVQMPRGIPVATVAINNSTNAALLAVRILGAADPKWLTEMTNYMNSMEEEVLAKVERLETTGYDKY